MPGVDCVLRASGEFPDVHRAFVGGATTRRQSGESAMAPNDLSGTA